MGNYIINGENLGLDLGTTTSSVSHVREDGAPEECAKVRDTIVVKTKTGKWEFGETARKRISNSDAAEIFKGFKMLLSEKDEKELARRGYSAENTPAIITKMYVENILKRALTERRSVNGRINKLVVGIPAVWWTDPKTYNDSEGLEKVIKSIKTKSGEGLVEDVQFYPEPQCSAAYVIDKYKKQYGADWSGKILVIDYGGGTLDITLCEVTNNNGRPDIQPINYWGTGKDDESFVGHAGMKFLETAVEIALERNDVEVSERNEHYSDFCKGVEELESVLINEMADVKEMLLDYCDVNYGPDDEVTSFSFNGKIVDITYNDVVKSYGKVIRNAFKEELRKVTSFLDSKKIPYGATNDKDDFRIAAVGGFCNFVLTQNDITKVFGDITGENDKRYCLDLFKESGESQKAISYGTALLAEGAVTITPVSGISIGFGVMQFLDCMKKSKKDEDIKEIFKGSIYYPIKKGMEIEYDKPYYAEDSDGNEIDVCTRSGQLRFMTFTNSDDPYLRKELRWGEILDFYKDKIQLDDAVYRIGFSMNKSMVLSLVVRKQEGSNRDKFGEPQKISLGNIDDVLGGNVIKGRLLTEAEYKSYIKPNAN